MWAAGKGDRRRGKTALFLVACGCAGAAPHWLDPSRSLIPSITLALVLGGYSLSTTLRGSDASAMPANSTPAKDGDGTSREWCGNYTSFTSNPSPTSASRASGKASSTGRIRSICFSAESRPTYSRSSPRSSYSPRFERWVEKSYRRRAKQEAWERRRFDRDRFWRSWGEWLALEATHHALAPAVALLVLTGVGGWWLGAANSSCPTLLPPPQQTGVR